ncbi:Photosystem I P700 chlorophyll a apoprotein A2 [Platanthera guangdongensis]|uniref:Photosystem I P700 chlorophyll a apoprotein A2 n=1 Tax=Platanthera guangdongensis TaxID=2320717 RepID=A0ABR2N071_9ASPA
MINLFQEELVSGQRWTSLWIEQEESSYGFDVLLSSTNTPTFNAGRSIWLPGWLNAINENSN